MQYILILLVCTVPLSWTQSSTTTTEGTTAPTTEELLGETSQIPPEETTIGPEPVCKNGDRLSPAKYDGCNKCICRQEKWACTKFKCPVTNTTTGSSTTEDYPTPPPVCKEGDTLTAKENDGCNACFCSGGLWACTAMACITNEDIETTTVAFSTQPPVCKEGDELTAKENDGCNECYCYEGQWMCEEMACVTNEDIETTTVDFSTQPPVCKEGDELTAKENDGCNECYCYEGQWMCEEMECITNEDIKTTTVACIEGETYEPDYCNTCTCMDGGWLCTEVGCPACIEGETYEPDYCNTCTCMDGGWFCTEVGCPGFDTTEQPVEDCEAATEAPSSPVQKGKN